MTVQKEEDLMHILAECSEGISYPQGSPSALSPLAKALPMYTTWNDTWGKTDVRQRKHPP